MVCPFLLIALFLWSLKRPMAMLANTIGMVGGLVIAILIASINSIEISFLEILPVNPFLIVFSLAYLLVGQST